MDLNRYFSKEGIQVARRQKERGSTSLIREMQTKPTTRHRFVPGRVACSERQEITSFSKEVEKREPSCIVGRSIN